MELSPDWGKKFSDNIKERKIMFWKELLCITPSAVMQMNLLNIKMELLMEWLIRQ